MDRQSSEDHPEEQGQQLRSQWDGAREGCREGVQGGSWLMRWGGWLNRRRGEGTAGGWGEGHGRGDEEEKEEGKTLNSSQPICICMIYNVSLYNYVSRIL